MTIPVSFHIRDKTVDSEVLIDSGAQGQFMDTNYARINNFLIQKLPEPITVRNADGSENEQGQITDCTWIHTKIGDQMTLLRLWLTNLGGNKMILGLPWLKEHNPSINWREGTVRIDPKERKRFIAQPMARPSEIKALKVHNEIWKPRTTSEEEHKIGEDQSLLISYIRNDMFQEWEQKTKPAENDYNRPRYLLARKTNEEPVYIRVKTSISQQLSHQEKNIDSEVKKTVEELVPEEYHEYKEVFEKKASERFPTSRIWDHAIDTKPDFELRDCKVYPMSPKEQTLLDAFLKEHLEKGYIRPSKSPMASPFFFIGKKDSDALRPVQDYRYLNNAMVKNNYPLPLISDLLDKLKGSKIFTKLDIRWGYNNVRIKDGDQWKAAFKTNKGLFEPMVMFFGMCNSPATFQSMMNELFKDMVEEHWLVIYMDDMLIHSQNIQEHQDRTKRVLERLRQNDLYLKAEKCKFDAKEVEYLGLLVAENQLRMDPIKLAGIQDWPEPSNVRGVRSFLGFGNFYRRFINHFSDLAKPLNHLTKKDHKWNWTEECQSAFESLKKRFLEGPTLLMPDPSKPFLIESDTSKWATGAVLRQQDVNEDWHPCGYISNGLNPAKRNYEIYDRELLRIIRVLETWKHYFIGSPYPVTILSDHKNLIYFRSPQKLNRRQA